MEPGSDILEVSRADRLPKLLLLLIVGRGAGSKLACSFGLRAGNGGSSASPHAGALIRLFPVEFTEVVDVPRPVVDLVVAVDVVEYDVSEVADSRDGRRFWSVGLRGGSGGRAGVGGGRRSDLRVGNGGGAFGFGFT